MNNIFSFSDFLTEKEASFAELMRTSNVELNNKKEEIVKYDATSKFQETFTIHKRNKIKVSYNHDEEYHCLNYRLETRTTIRRSGRFNAILEKAFKQTLFINGEFREVHERFALDTKIALLFPLCEMKVLIRVLDPANRRSNGYNFRVITILNLNDSDSGYAQSGGEIDRRKDKIVEYLYFNDIEHEIARNDKKNRK
jgi:hypothetical protein